MELAISTNSGKSYSHMWLIKGYKWSSISDGHVINMRGILPILDYSIHSGRLGSWYD